MSVSGIKLLAATELVLETNGPLYRTRFRPTHSFLRPDGTTFDSGGVDTPITDATESTFNLTIQQACADVTNADSGNIEQFTAADVIGGRV